MVKSWYRKGFVNLQVRNHQTTGDVRSPLVPWEAPQLPGHRWVAILCDGNFQNTLPVILRKISQIYFQEKISPQTYLFASSDCSTNLSVFMLREQVPVKDEKLQRSHHKCWISRGWGRWDLLHLRDCLHCIRALGHPVCWGPWTGKKWWLALGTSKTRSPNFGMIDADHPRLGSADIECNPCPCSQITSHRIVTDLVISIEDFPSFKVWFSILRMIR